MAAGLIIIINDVVFNGSIVLRIHVYTSALHWSANDIIILQFI